MSNVPAPAPATGIHLHTSFFPLAIFLFLFAPHASVDGGPPLRLGWGDAFVPAAPGSHRLDIWFDYFFGPAGKTAGMIDVPAQGVARISYKAPFWWVFSSGTLTVDGVGPVPALPPATPAAPPIAAQQPQPQAVAATSAHQPQWDAQRSAYIQWDAAQQRWYQFDDAAQQWRPIG